MRDKTLDGYRAVAALGVVFAHSVLNRFNTLPHLHYAQRIAFPLAHTSVRIFFVISGYIITTLLLKEREQMGRISIRAFYIRRVCRIIPPLAAVLLMVAALGLADAPSLAMASTFTCNIGTCSWNVGHTWSLSVEEQFYLLWPMLLIGFSPRPQLIGVAILAILACYLIVPWVPLSNYISFSCIGAGTLFACSNRLRELVARARHPVAWALVAGVLLISPLYTPFKFEALTPFLIVYLLFATPLLVKRVLALPPVQIVGAASYSLYLWQQLFLGPNSTAPLWALPLVVAASVVLIERSFIRLGRRLSGFVTDREDRTVAVSTASAV